MYDIVDGYLKDRGIDISKEENWGLEESAFAFLNENIGVDFDRTYEHDRIRVNIIIKSTDEITFGNKETDDQIPVPAYIANLAEAQGHNPIRQH